MSIILKGIDLPEEGKQITLAIFPDGDIVSYKYWLPKDSQAIQIPKKHGRLKDFDADGVHPVIVDGEYMVRVDDLDEIPTILEAEW
jgi:hypothetical protein